MRGLPVLLVLLLGCPTAPDDTGDTGPDDTADTGSEDTADTGSEDTADTGPADTADTDPDDTGADDTGTDDTDDADTDDTGDPPVFEPGVYVAPTGDDAAAGTPLAPLRTVAAGLALAAVEGGPVRVAAGEYSEHVTVTGTLIGGYVGAAWTHDPSAHVTTIVAPDATAPTVHVAPSTSATVRHLALRGPGTALRVQGATIAEDLDIASTIADDGEAVVHVDGATWTATEVRIASDTAWALLRADAGTTVLDAATLSGGNTATYGLYAADYATLTLDGVTIDAWQPVRAPLANLFFDDVTLVGVRAALELDAGYAQILGGALSADSTEDPPIAAIHGGPSTTIVLDRVVARGAAAAAFHGANAVITNSVLTTGSAAAPTASAVRLSTGVVAHNAIAIEHATDLAVALEVATSAVIVNNVFGSFGAAGRAGLLLPDGGGTPSLGHNLLWGPHGTAWVALEPEGTTIGVGDMNDCGEWPRGCATSQNNRVGDPHFADWPDDVRLTVESTEAIGHGGAVDAWIGDATTRDRLAADHYGDPRPNTAPDIGPTQR